MPVILRVCLLQDLLELSAPDSGPMLSVYTVISGFAASTKRTSLTPLDFHIAGPTDGNNRPVVDRIWAMNVCRSST